MPQSSNAGVQIFMWLNAKNYEYYLKIVKQFGRHARTNKHRQAQTGVDRHGQVETKLG